MIKQTEPKHIPIPKSEIISNYTNFALQHEFSQRYQYSCISKSTGKKCVYNCYIFALRNKNKERIKEINEILFEAWKFKAEKSHFQGYLDYNIKLSQKNVKIEIIREINCKSLNRQTPFELAIFYFNLRHHIRDILIALSYLKSRFIGDNRWLIFKNIGFNANKNHIELQNFIFIGENFNYMKTPADFGFYSEKQLDILKKKGRVK